jgi:hypothetical protein
VDLHRVVEGEREREREREREGERGNKDLMILSHKVEHLGLG